MCEISSWVKKSQVNMLPSPPVKAHDHSELRSLDQKTRNNREVPETWRLGPRFEKKILPSPWILVMMVRCFDQNQAGVWWSHDRFQLLKNRFSLGRFIQPGARFRSKRFGQMSFCLDTNSLPSNQRYFRLCQWLPFIQKDHCQTYLVLCTQIFTYIHTYIPKYVPIATT